MANYSVLIGSAGVTLLLLAFFMNLFKLLKQDSWAYAGMNILGAGASCYASYLIQYMPFVVLEGAWVLVAMVGLFFENISTKYSSRNLSFLVPPLAN